MKNNGEKPPVAVCDIRFRNGEIRRAIDTQKWRWKPWEWGESDFDIVDWQHPNTNTAR